MRKWLSIGAFAAIVSLCFAFKNVSPQSSSGDLYVQLKNIRNTDGVIYLFLYNYENQYPRAPFTYYTVEKSNVKNGYLKVKMSNVEYRDAYAITLIDDENNNEDLDRILGIPTEGFGFSNNVRPIISLPKYKELLFNFKYEKTIHIDLQYFL